MWKIVVYDWFPNLNKSRGRHWSKSHEQTKTAGDIFRAEAVNAGVPLVNRDKGYTPVRAVDISLITKGNLPDPDNLLKHTLDGLKRASLIVDDKEKWCKWSKPKVEGEWPDAKHKSTLTVTIRDTDFGTGTVQVEPRPDFTRAVVESRPWYAGMNPTAHDFRLYFRHPDKSEQLWCSYSACDPLHLKRLTDWCAAMGVPVEPEPATGAVATATRKTRKTAAVLPDPDLFW